MVLTSSDIGIDPTTVELSLTKHFRMAMSCKFTVPGEPVSASPSQQVGIV
jgi:hypothetical protein